MRDNLDAARNVSDRRPGLVKRSGQIKRCRRDGGQGWRAARRNGRGRGYRFCTGLRSRPLTVRLSRLLDLNLRKVDRTRRGAGFLALKEQAAGHQRNNEDAEQGASDRPNPSWIFRTSQPRHRNLSRGRFRKQRGRAPGLGSNCSGQCSLFSWPTPRCIPLNIIHRQGGAPLCQDLVAGRLPSKRDKN